MGNVVELSQSNFDAEVLQSAVPVVVDFWAPWCNPCRAIAPLLEELATANMGRAKVGKVNVDQNQHLAMQFAVENIPTVIIFRNGEEVDRVVGLKPGMPAWLQNSVDQAANG